MSLDKVPQSYSLHWSQLLQIMFDTSKVLGKLANTLVFAHCKNQQNVP